jgi:hypothetical protein
MCKAKQNLGINQVKKFLTQGDDIPPPRKGGQGGYHPPKIESRTF